VGGHAWLMFATRWVIWLWVYVRKVRLVHRLAFMICTMSHQFNFIAMAPSTQSECESTSSALMPCQGSHKSRTAFLTDVRIIFADVWPMALSLVLSREIVKASLLVAAMTSATCRASASVTEILLSGRVCWYVVSMRIPFF
jgi:hypothetical protein